MICDDEPVAWISGKVIHQFPDLAGGYEPLYRKAKKESMIKNTLRENWINSAQNAIDQIDLMLGSKDDFDQEFVSLAKFILESECNPWGFMPDGWENVNSDAQGMKSFLHNLHHALVDDGDVCFIDVPVHGSFMVFIDLYDLNHIEKVVAKRFSMLMNIPKYEVHCDIERFMKGVR